MGVPRIDPGSMTVEQFLAFTDTRPDEEKWELFDGVPEMQASANYVHQRIVMNIASALDRLSMQPAMTWQIIPGIGALVSPKSLPVPDLLVRPKGIIEGQICNDVLVAFEVLSRSTKKRDLDWKRNAYPTMPQLLAYVVVAQEAWRVQVFEASGERSLEHADDRLDLPALGIALPLTDIYRDTGLKPA